VTSPADPHRLPPARWLPAAQEAVLFSLVAIAPWAFGAVEPVFEFALLLGLAALLLLTAARAVLERGLRGATCPLALVLTGLVLVTACQIVPLPEGVVAALSPNARRLTAELLPERPELLPGEPARPAAGWHTLSLDPPATRRLLVRLLAVTLFYWVARTQVASQASLRRLAWVLLADGVALAVLGIAQEVSSPTSVVYWTFPTPGRVFGPFVYHSHFPCFLFPCLGLGAGLLAARGPGPSADWPGPPPAGRARLGAWLAGPLELLHSPRNLWVSGGLALMLAGVLMSQSRGGVVALALAAAGVALACRPRAKRSAGWLAVGVAGALAAGLLAWLGWDEIQGRLGTLARSGTFRESRGQIWLDLLPLVPAFLLWGTGGGTLRFVEPLHHQGAAFSRVVTDNAHNEYLEALVEGGLIRLALTLLLVGVLAAGAVRSWRRARGRSHEGLVRGAAFGLLAIALHSAVDFGLHLPAIALLAAVVAAQLMAAGEESPQEAQERPGAGWGRPSAVLLAAVLIALAAGLGVEGWTADRVERLRLAAESEGRRAGGGGRGVDYLRAAVALRPRDGHLLLALAEAELAAAQGPEARLAALGHLREARDRAPLEAAAHVALAAHRRDFASADPAGLYLDRACRLRPDEAEFWYTCGLSYLQDGQPDTAWPRWRNCLALSDGRLRDVLNLALPRLGPAAACERVMPDRPDLLLEAAEQLFPRDEDAASRRPFLERALGLSAAPRDAEEFYRRARIERLLDRPEEAVVSYRAALARRPGELAWRRELAQLFRQQRRWAEAERELLTILVLHPGDPRAEALLPVLRREMELDR
jgi:tetratricopeptide (TPR) repeat protein/O-antigen ligase